MRIEFSQQDLQGLPLWIVQRLQDYANKPTDNLDLSRHASLTSIDFGFPSLVSLPACLVKLTGLKSLKLSNHLLSELKAEYLPPKLEELVVFGNPLESVSSNYSFGLHIDSRQWLKLHSIFNPECIVGFRLITRDLGLVNELERLPFYQNLKALDLSELRLKDWPSSWPPQLQHLNLSSNQLIDWPSSWPSQLQTLNLENNQLKEWCSSWPSQLQSLNLENNPLKDWPSSWPSQLLALYLRNNQLEDWPSSWPPQLHNLDLSDNQLKNWPSSWPPQLKTLFLWNNQLKDWPSSWPAQLHTLYLRNNQLKAWPSPWPSQLQYLNLSNNPLKDWPSSWPSQLQTLFLRNSHLENWPSSWPAQLQSLHIESNQLKGWPLPWPQMLQTLTLWGKQLKDWPQSWPSQLRSLSLGDTRLKTWPLSWPSKLQRLVLINHQIRDWPSSWPLQLQSLDLENNQLKDWPSLWPSQLQTLYLRNNQLEDWPSTWPPQLRSLDLANNPLKNWPQSWPTQLQNLNLRDNHLSAWPLSWPQKMQYLNLYGNQFSDWPDNFPSQLLKLNLKNNHLSDLFCDFKLPDYLHYLNIDKNSFPEDLQAIVESGIYAIEKYAEEQTSFQQQHAGKPLRIPIREAKLMIVGEPGAGKTSLMNKLLDESFIPRPKEGQSTHGINIKNWGFVDPNDNKQNYRANIWDFGGQEIQFSTHRFFLTERAVYILVADNREQKTDFDYWFHIIHLLGRRDSKVIVFLHDICGRQVSNFYQDKYAKKYPALDIVCRRADLADSQLHAFRDLRSTLSEAMVALPFVNETVDRRIFAVKQEVIRLRAHRHHLSYEAFEKICIECDLQKSMVEACLRYLNWMGIVIYFDKERSSLRDFIIIDPAWAVNPIYQVFVTSVVQKNGSFRQDFFFQQLGNELYSEVEKTKLLELLKRNHFEICYPINERSDTWQENPLFVVPQLLPKTPNDLNIKKHPAIQGSELSTEFHYNFLPKGLFARLVVRNFQRVQRDAEKKQQIVWRAGALFEFFGAYLLATMEDDSDKLYALIRLQSYGPAHQQRQALNKFRGELLEINRDMSRNLEAEVDEKLPCICDSCEGSVQPYFFSLRELQTYIKKKKATIDCRKSTERVSILELAQHIVGDYLPYEQDHLPRETLENQSELILKEDQDKLELDKLLALVRNALSVNVNVNTTTNAAAQAEAKADIDIQINIKNQACFELSGQLDKLAERLGKEEPAALEAKESIEEATHLVESLEQAGDSEKKQAKRKLSRIKSFVDELADANTTLGKFISTAKGARENAEKIIDGYNKIAPWCGAPCIPNVFQQSKQP